VFSEGSCDTEDWSNDAENTGILHLWKDERVYIKWVIYVEGM